MVASYPQIGVILAESDAIDFAAKLGSDAWIETVASSNQPVAKGDPVELESHDGRRWAWWPAERTRDGQRHLFVAPI
jgi:hypothetical protein